MKWKEKWFPNNVMRDSVMQISNSVILKRDFGGNTSMRMWQQYIIHRGPGFQQVKTTHIPDFIFYFRNWSFTMWVANCNKWICGLGSTAASLCLERGTGLGNPVMCSPAKLYSLSVQLSSVQTALLILFQTPLCQTPLCQWKVWCSQKVPLSSAQTTLLFAAVVQTNW